MLNLLNGLNLKCKLSYITSTEPGGHLWGLILAHSIGKPINIIRVKDPNLPTNDNLQKQRTGYCVRNLYFENFKEGDNIIIVEDVISTGSTIKIIIDTLSSKNVNVVGVLCIVRKGIDNLDKDYSIPIKSIVDLGKD